jgi:hypothetical protein
LDTGSVHKQLKLLRNDDKFRYFLRINELDPVKILSMPSEPVLSNGLTRTFTKSSLEGLNDSILESTDLSYEDYVKFSFII